MNAPHRRDLAKYDAENPKPPEDSEEMSHLDRNKARWARETWHSERYRISSRIIPDVLSRKGVRAHDDAVYCDARCEQQHIQKVADVNLAHEDAEKEAERRWPGAPSYASKRWPYLDANVTFRPVGFRADVTWNVKRDEVYFFEEDRALWEALDAKPIEETDDHGQTQDA